MTIVRFIDKNNVSVKVDIVEVDAGRIEVQRSYKLSICYMADIIGIGQNTYTNWKKDLNPESTSLSG